MYLSKVVGSVWMTQKEKGMENLKLLIVQPLNLDRKLEGNAVIAVDRIGAGVGEIVLITSGTPAQRIMGDRKSPIDAAVVGIVDSFEVHQ